MHDLNDFVSLYEKDLVDKYLLDQEITLWKRKWAQCSLEERPDSLGAALQQCDEERFPNIFRLLKANGCSKVLNCSAGAAALNMAVSVGYLLYMYMYWDNVVASCMALPYTSDWSKYQAKSIKLGMNQFSPLFSQKAEASMLASFTTPLSELVEMALFSSSAACLSSSGQRGIAFDAGLTCDGSSSEQQGQLTAPDAAMHSVRHLVRTSELHASILVAVKERWNTVHTSCSFSKIDRLFTLAKVGLGSCNKAGGEAIFWR
eukprot:Em0010g221a